MVPKRADDRAASGGERGLRRTTTIRIHSPPRPVATVDDDLVPRSDVPLRDRYLLTVLAGAQLGEVHRVVPEGVVLGRSDTSDLPLSDPGLSWSHAKVTQREDGIYIEDLGSTNGTYVRGERITEPTRLADGDRIRLGGQTMLKLTLADELEERAAHRLYESVVRDPLTGVHNRRYFEERLEAEVAFALRHGSSLAVLFVDVDHFKQVNDKFGHNVGDAVLRILAMSIERVLRPGDLLARFGGEEFVIVARSIGTRNGEILAERIRRTIADLTLPLDGELTLTVSIGVAAIDAGRGARDGAALIAAADAAMYRAKEHGRNRTSVAP